MSSGGGHEKSYYNEYRENNELEAGKKRVEEGLPIPGWGYVSKGKQRAPSSVAATDGGDMEVGQSRRANEWGHIEKSVQGASSTVAATDGGETRAEEEGLPGYSKREEGHTLEEWKNVNVPKAEVQAPSTVAATDGGYTEVDQGEGESRSERKNILLREKTQAPTTVAATDGGDGPKIVVKAFPAGKARDKDPGAIQATGKISYKPKNSGGDDK